MKSYLINLDRDVARLAHMCDVFGRFGIAYERLAATDGASLQDPGSAITRGEMGCLSSHRRVLEKIAGGADRYAAVFEDDIHIARALVTYLARVALPAICPTSAVC